MHSRRYIGSVHHPPSRSLKNTANLASLERRAGTCAKYRAVMSTYSGRDNAKGNLRVRTPDRKIKSNGTHDMGSGDPR